MPLDNRYRKSREQSIVSYDWNDISEGTGVVTFYAGKIASSPNLMSSQPFHSTIVDTGIAPNSTGSYTIATLSFETSFNFPKIIKGKMWISIAHGFTPNFDSSSTGDFSDDITIKKNSTTLASGTMTAAQTVESSDSNEGLSVTITDVFDISKTKFTSGDTLTIEITAKVDIGSNEATATIAHSPMGKTSSDNYDLEDYDDLDYSNSGSKLLINVPFDLDI